STMLESHQMGFLVLLSFLPTASTIGILNSINALKKIPFGQSVPKHSLVLLHWFANTIEIDNNDLIELNFDPNHGDYGAHRYVNFEGFLDPLPFGHRYLTLGNINPMINNQRRSLPSYFTNDLNHLLRGEVLNRARIIITLSSQNTIGQVYITQHYQANQGQGTLYDPEHTYRITIDLLRELRVFSLDRGQHSELSEIGGDFGSSIDYYELYFIKNTWGQLACVGLLLFIVINQKNDIPFGRSVPKHSLVLLHWFANTIELTNNNRLELNFDPDQGDYGAHHYVNVQGFLDPLPFRHRYFTLGNINPLINNQRRSMPSYFTNDLNRLLRGEVLNRARIIFSYSSQDTVGQVFITQHYQASQGQGTVYDPEHTYRISINLLRELRVFSLDQHSELSEIGGDFGSSIDYYELSSLRNTSNMSESHLMGFLVLFLSILPTESTIGNLNSINDLKKIPFGQSVPKHSLVLLHWFANTIEFDNNDLIELTFEPSNGDYGTHHYGNYEGVLDRLPPGQQYYTLGNINPMINNNGNSLPSYVAGHVNHLLGGEELNRARIIFSLLDQDTIDQVFITQHYEANQDLGTGYDPVHTYQITFNLLRVLRVFSLDRRQHSDMSEIGGNIGSGINDHELSSIGNTWGQLASTGMPAGGAPKARYIISPSLVWKIPFGQSVPKHSLVLLHWFANTIEIDNNDAIELTFEPNHGDYGTHHYGNYEGVLDRLPPGQQYYTLGNSMINNHRISLPSYVTGDVNHLLGGEVMNRARIIFSLLGQDIIDQVFITQHYQASQGQGTVYDPVHTYQITINLLRELRVFSLDQNQQSELSEIRTNFGSGIDYDKLCFIRNTWGQLACVGLLLFIVINERNTPCRPNRARESRRPPKRACQTKPRFKGDDRRGESWPPFTGVEFHALQGGVMLVLSENQRDASGSTGPHWGTFETSAPLSKRYRFNLHEI
ncbi:unnamed protein product, partial [Gadus morhua 'NCC']